jgi:hypothetical protein
MARRLAGFMIDCQGGTLPAASRFWSHALGLPVMDADEGGAGRYALLGAAAGQWHVEVQLVEHPSRLHLDIEADDIDVEAARLEALGATRQSNPNRRWWVMQAPTGHRFCVIRWRDREPPSPPIRQRGASHHSGLVALVLDCQVDSLDVGLDFWSQALERGVANRDQDGDGKYGELETSADEPFLLLQKVAHDPRVHLDIQADDQDAEVARLEALGAKKIQFLKRWWVLEAPTGHRFCVVRQQAEKPGLPSNAWA